MIHGVLNISKASQNKVFGVQFTIWLTCLSAQQPCAERHVSYILSACLSSRPFGWSQHNLENIAQLRMMKANGQQIVYTQLSRQEKHPADSDKSSEAHSPGSFFSIQKETPEDDLSQLENRLHQHPHSD